VTCAAMLTLTAALVMGVLSTASLILVVMLCTATAARSVLWTVAYPLGAEAAERRGIGLGATVGLLNGIWAATAVLGPLGAGLANQHLGSQAAFGLTDTVCAAALAVTAAAWLPTRRLAARRLAARRLATPVVDPSPVLTAQAPSLDRSA
jgi:MFS family permease